MVCPQELKEGIDVVLGDAVNNLPFVPYKLHDHLGNIQPDSSLQTNENQNHYYVGNSYNLRIIIFHESLKHSVNE